MNSEDTYENAKVLADEQIASERVVTDALDATERDVLEFWDEFIEVPYGQKYTMHIRADLSNTDHLRFCQLIDGVKTSSSESDNIFIEALELITTGIYNGDDLVVETDRQFWEDDRNWSALKIKRIIGTYFRHFKEETEKTISFLEEEAE